MEDAVAEATIHRLAVALLPLVTFTPVIEFAAGCETLITELAGRCAGLTSAALHSTALHLLASNAALAHGYAALTAYFLQRAEAAVAGEDAAWWGALAASASLRASRVEAVQCTPLRMF